LATYSEAIERLHYGRSWIRNAVCREDVTPRFIQWVYMGVKLIM